MSEELLYPGQEETYLKVKSLEVIKALKKVLLRNQGEVQLEALPFLDLLIVINLIRHGNLVDTRKLFQNWFHDFRVVIGTPRLFSGSQLVTKSNSVGDIRRRRMLVPGLYFWGPYRVTALGHPDCTLNLFGPFWNLLRYAGIFADIVWVMVLQRRILLGPIFPLRFARECYTRRHT